MAMPMAMSAKGTLDMNMMRRQESPPRIERDLEGTKLDEDDDLGFSPMIELEAGSPVWSF